MAQINIKKSTSFVIPNENCRAYGFDALGNPVYVDEQGLAYSLSSNSPSSNNSSNIVANRGVGLESELPVTAIVGDIYVSTDTFKVFQALNATDWQTDLLIPGVLITDTKATLIIVYQFLNDNLHTISGPAVFTDETLEISKNEDVTAITTLRDVLKNTSNYFIQSGAVITDNGDNTISITEAQAWVKTDIADNSEFRAVKIAAKDLTIEADKNILLYINYNAGQATFEQTESTPGFFYSYYNKIPFATCVNIGDSIIVNNFAEVGRNSVYKNTLSQINYQAFRYIEGLGTVSNVSRNVLTSPGVVIFANEGMTIAGLNTSSGSSFTRLYYDDGAWERIAGQTVIDNENYNDVATGLAVIPNNKYAKKYLYYVKSLVDYYIVIEGQMTFDDLATAKTANLPAVLPPEVSNYYAGALLVAVFIVKAGEDEIIEIQNPFKQPFSSQATSAKPSDLSFALSDETSDLTTSNDGEIEVRRAQTLVSITLAVNVAPTGSSILCDVKKNGTTILTTPIELPAASTTVTITAPQIATTALAVGDRLKADITQIGATVPGAGAKIYPLTELT